MGCLQELYTWFNFALCGVLSVFLVLLGCAILLIYSGVTTFNESVGQNQYGVSIDYYNGDISDVKDQGSYRIPLGSKLYLFERVLHDSGITSITCLTGDGIVANLDITIQYQYDRDEVVDTILLQFNTDENYSEMLSTLLTSAVQDACGQFTAIEYQTERAAVDLAMQNFCQWKLSNASLLSEVLVQLKNIDLPVAYTNLVAQKQSTDQAQTTALNNRAVALTQANTTLLNAQLAAQIPVIDAKQTAAITLLNAYAQGNYTVQQWVQRAIGFASVKLANGFNNSGLLAYIRSQIVAGSSGALFSL